MDIKISWSYIDQGVLGMTPNSKLQPKRTQYSFLKQRAKTSRKITICIRHTTYFQPPVGHIDSFLRVLPPNKYKIYKQKMPKITTKLQMITVIYSFIENGFIHPFSRQIWIMPLMLTAQGCAAPLCLSFPAFVSLSVLQLLGTGSVLRNYVLALSTFSSYHVRIPHPCKNCVESTNYSIRVCLDLRKLGGKKKN